MHVVQEYQVHKSTKSKMHHARAAVLGARQGGGVWAGSKRWSSRSHAAIFSATRCSRALALPTTRTAAQVCLRFLVQQNVVVIPQTGKLERLSENAAIFDFQP